MPNKSAHKTKHAKTNHRINDSNPWNRFWQDKHGDVVIAQMPNIWLILWFIFELISLFVASHRQEIITWWIATAALGIWSLLEIFKGASYFRRLLGLCVAAITLLSVFGVGL